MKDTNKELADRLREYYKNSEAKPIEFRRVKMTPTQIRKYLMPYLGKRK